MKWYEISLSATVKTDELPDEETIARFVTDALMNIFDDANVIVDYMEEEREAIQAEIDSLREQLEKTKADLIIAENNRIEVEVVPQNIQEERDALMAAAEDAEARAAAAEEELEKLRAERVESNVSEYEKLSYQIRVFMINCQIMVAHVNDLLPDRDKAIRDIDRLRNWCEIMRDELGKAVIIPEGADVQ